MQIIFNQLYLLLLHTNFKMYYKLQLGLTTHNLQMFLRAMLQSGYKKATFINLRTSLHMKLI